MSNNSGGRPESKLVWDEIEITVEEDGRLKQKCKHCDYFQLSRKKKATNLAKHLVKCQHVPPAKAEAIWADHRATDNIRVAGEKRGFSTEKESLSPDAMSTAMMSTMSTTSTLTTTDSFASFKRQKSVCEYTDFCDDERAKRINMAIMRFLAGCGVAISLVESSHFIALMMAANKAFAVKYLPKADCFTRTWLPALCNSIKQTLAEHWGASSEHITLGCDGFKGENNNKVYILTQAKQDLVKFVDCVAEGEHRQGKEVIAAMWEEHMKETAEECNKTVEEGKSVLCFIYVNMMAVLPCCLAFAAIVADNTGVNPAAGKIIEEKYPKIFFNGCRTHCADLLIEDCAKEQEVKILLAACQSAVKFVRNHQKVKAAYTRIAEEEGGTQLKDFPETRFAFCHLTLKSLLGPQDKNVAVLQKLINDDDWAAITQDTRRSLIDKFEALVSDVSFFQKIKQLLKLTGPICTFIHHLEREGARASWLLPAFEALEKDLAVWADDITVGLYFSRTTRNNIKKAFRSRYRGEGRVMAALRQPQFVFAMLVDPSMTVGQAEAPQGWEEDCDEVLRRFYSGADLFQAKAELNDLLLQEGTWGKHVTDIKEHIAVPHRNKTHIQVVIEEQLKTVVLKSDKAWRAVFCKQFPKLAKVAVRVLTMATQSADVERSCKVHKIIHSKSRNRLKLRNVIKLMYCYVNLRLLQKIDKKGAADTAHLVDFLADAILDASEGGD